MDGQNDACLLNLSTKISTPLQGAMTAKGKILASLPVEPMWGAVLLAAARLDCLDQALIVVAMASTDPFYVHTRCACNLVRLDSCVREDTQDIRCAS